MWLARRPWLSLLLADGSFRLKYDSAGCPFLVLANETLKVAWPLWRVRY